MLERICKAEKLGTIQFKEQLYGGFLHTMFHVVTENGEYAIKLLNPEIMKKETALHNYQRCDRLEKKITNIPLVKSSGIQCLDDVYYYVFEYFHGKAVASRDVTVKQCVLIGETLAKLHAIEQFEKEIHIDYEMISWEKYIEACPKEISELLKDHLDVLKTTESCVLNANLPHVVCISHNDLDCKNVLWNGLDYRIVDLECLNYNSPYQELLDTAMYWSGFDSFSFSEAKFKAFIDAYYKNNYLFDVCWKEVYESNTARLGWLEYNLKRTINNEQIGILEAKKTIQLIVDAYKLKDTIVRILEELK